MNETYLYNGQEAIRADMAASTAASFNGGNKVKYSFDAISMDHEAGETEGGKTKAKLVGNMIVTPVDADGKKLEGVSELKNELTYIWVDGKVVEAFGPAGMDEMKAALRETARHSQ